MKKITAIVVAILCVLGVAFYGVNANAYSYEDVVVERVAKYNGPLDSTVELNDGYAKICEAVTSGSIEVGVSNVEYSNDGSIVTVTLYNKNEVEVKEAESNYFAYWNIYVPTNDNTTKVNVIWE